VTVTLSLIAHDQSRGALLSPGMRTCTHTHTHRALLHCPHSWPALRHPYTT
jgi:hypothetical protein